MASEKRTQAARSASPSIVASALLEIADGMEAWHRAGAADGFNLMFPLLPDDWTKFAELVVPELQPAATPMNTQAESAVRGRENLM